MKSQKSIFKNEKDSKEKEGSKKISPNVKFIILAVVLIILFCFAITPVTLQNDTFYTIKIGEHIQNFGIDMQDPFSWHEGLSYTYPHWLYDLLTYWIYALFNMDGIYIVTCILSCVLGISIYYVNYKLNKNNLISFLLTIGVMYLIKSYVAARAQLVTFILFIWTVYFIERFLQTKKWRYGIFLCLISLVIANLHVAVWPFFFVLFLPYIAEYAISALGDTILYKRFALKCLKFRYNIYQKRNNTEKAQKILDKIDDIESRVARIKVKREENIKKPYKIKIVKNNNVKFLILIMIVCALMGLITPIGDTPYTYLYKTMIGNTTQNINEHLPMTLSDQIPVMCTLIVFLAILIFTKAKIKLSDLFMLGGLTYLMLTSRRQLTMFALMGSIVLGRLIVDMFKRYNTDSEWLLKILVKPLGMTILICVMALFSLNYIEPKLDDEYIDELAYPVKACDYILSEDSGIDLTKAKFYNEYNYGSYMLFRGIPVFIDSRADLYSPEFNGLNEDIFMDFINTSNIGVFYEDTFEKYGITHVICYKNAKMNMIITKTNDPNYNLIYSDNNFVIYERLSGIEQMEE